MPEPDTVWSAERELDSLISRLEWLYIGCIFGGVALWAGLWWFMASWGPGDDLDSAGYDRINFVVVLVVGLACAALFTVMGRLLDKAKSRREAERARRKEEERIKAELAAEAARSRAASEAQAYVRLQAAELYAEFDEWVQRMRRDWLTYLPSDVAADFMTRVDAYRATINSTAFNASKRIAKQLEAKQTPKRLSIRTHLRERFVVVFGDELSSLQGVPAWILDAAKEQFEMSTPQAGSIPSG